MINEASATASPAVLYTFPCGLGLVLVTPSCLPAGPWGLGALALPDHSSWGWAGDTGGTGAGGLKQGLREKQGLALEVGTIELIPTLEGVGGTAGVPFGTTSLTGQVNQPTALLH